MSSRVAATAVSVVLLSVAGFGCGGYGDSDSTSSTSTSTPAELSAADAETETTLRNAQTAIETYATDTAGSYAGATLDKLAKIEPSLSGAAVEVDAADQTYTLSADTELSGNSFSVTRNEDGSVRTECTTTGTGACPASGHWG